MTNSVTSKQAAPVRVKPLVWVRMNDGTASSNVTVVGLRYHATHLGWRHRNGPLHDADGVEAAKAAAQADYEARILAALDTPDAAVMAELAEALQDARTYVLQVSAEGSRQADDCLTRINAALAKLGGR